MRFAEIEHVQQVIGVDRLLDIADHDGDRVLDEAVVERALDDASSLASSYLDGEVVPVPPPFVLRRAVVDIAVQLMREPRDRSTDASQRAHDAAIKWLERIAEGKATLTPSTPTATATGDAAGPVTLEADDREWTRAAALKVL